MIFEIISGGEKTDWVGKEWAGLFFPRGKNGLAHSFPGEKNWLGGKSGLLHRVLFLLTFLFTFGFTFRKHTCNICISEIAISNLFRKPNVSINSSLILRTTNAVLELVTIWYYSIALRLFRPCYAIVIVKRDKCRNCVNIGIAKQR